MANWEFVDFLSPGHIAATEVANGFSPGQILLELQADDELIAAAESALNAALDIQPPPKQNMKSATKRNISALLAAGRTLRSLIRSRGQVAGSPRIGDECPTDWKTGRIARFSEPHYKWLARTTGYTADEVRTIFQRSLAMRERFGRVFQPLRYVEPRPGPRPWNSDWTEPPAYSTARRVQAAGGGGLPSCSPRPSSHRTATRLGPSARRSLIDRVSILNHNSAYQCPVSRNYNKGPNHNRTRVDYTAHAGHPPYLSALERTRGGRISRPSSGSNSTSRRSPLRRSPTYPRTDSLIPPIWRPRPAHMPPCPEHPSTFREISYYPSNRIDPRTGFMVPPPWYKYRHDVYGNVVVERARRGNGEAYEDWFPRWLDKEAERFGFVEWADGLGTETAIRYEGFMLRGSIEV